MKSVKFNPDEQGIGRFGILRKGDCINLTAKEWADVKKDKRFTAIKENTYNTWEVGFRKRLAELKDQADRDDEISREGYTKLLVEISRCETLLGENAKWVDLEITEMNRTDLKAAVKALKKKFPYCPISVRPTSNIRTLRKEYRLWHGWTEEQEAARKAELNPVDETSENVDGASGVDETSTVPAANGELILN